MPEIIYYTKREVIELKAYIFMCFSLIKNYIIVKKQLSENDYINLSD